MSRIVTHKFQDKATTVGDGVEYAPIKGSSELVLNIAISGTATERTVVFETKGSVGGYVPMMCSNISSTQFATSSSATTDEIWQVDLAGVKSIRVRISSIFGGYLDVAGEVVDDD